MISSYKTSTGVISGEDGNRYEFKSSCWKEVRVPIRGQKIDFKLDNGVVSDIYLAIGASQSGSGTGNAEKSRLTAGLLAIFLGGLGIHKFYLGYNRAGVISVICATFGWLLIFPAILNMFMAWAEAIIYLTKTDEQFQEIYVQNKKEWL